MIRGAFFHSVTLIIVLSLTINFPPHYQSQLIFHYHLYNSQLNKLSHIWRSTPIQHKNARILYVMFSFTASEGFMYAFFRFTNSMYLFLSDRKWESFSFAPFFRCCCCCSRIFWFFSVSMLYSSAFFSFSSLVEKKLSEIEWHAINLNFTQDNFSHRWLYVFMLFFH